MHLSCSKELACKQVVPSQMLLVVSADRGCKMLKVAASFLISHLMQLVSNDLS